MHIKGVKIKLKTMSNNLILVMQKNKLQNQKKKLTN